MENELMNEEEQNFIVDIKNKIRNSQYEAMKAVNQTLINLYWGIGQEIYNQQQEKGWGKSIVEVLSKEIQKDFPDVKGFSSSNLWRMRNFYVTYSNAENLAPLVREISWSKNITIMEKCKDQLEREFYIKMTKKYVNQAKLAVKDEYIFAFMGSQYHINVGGADFYIDLLLYHRSLKSLVAIELKIGDFKPEFVGQLQFYLTALDKQVKMDHENPSIGIIICKNKNRTVVEYALNDSYKPIGVATYQIRDTLPEKMKDLLPSPEEIKKRLEGLN